MMNKIITDYADGLDKNTDNPRTQRAPAFGRHHFFGTSEHYEKAHGSLLYG